MNTQDFKDGKTIIRTKFSFLSYHYFFTFKNKIYGMTYVGDSADVGQIEIEEDDFKKILKDITISNNRFYDICDKVYYVLYTDSDKKHVKYITIGDEIYDEEFNMIPEKDYQWFLSDLHGNYLSEIKDDIPERIQKFIEGNKLPNK